MQREEACGDRLDSHESDPAYPIVAEIVKLVPAARWSYAGFGDDGKVATRFASREAPCDVEDLLREVKRHRAKVSVGPRIAASLDFSRHSGSGMTLIFADARATYGVLALFRQEDAGLFTSAEVAMLTLGLDSASERLAALRSLPAARVLEAEPVERPTVRASDVPESAMYVLDLDLRIVLSYASEAQRRVVLSGLRTQDAHRLPEPLECSVRVLTSEWNAGLNVAGGSSRPLPFITLHATPLAGATGLFVGVRIERSRPSNSLTEAVARFKITAREAQVLALMLDGHYLEDIARLLAISSSTVQDHIKNMTYKTGSRNRAELIARVLGWAAAETKLSETENGGRKLPNAIHASDHHLLKRARSTLRTGGVR